MRTYYRIQPRGLPVSGHTSETGIGLLPRGYVFAYTSPGQVEAGLVGWPPLDPIEILEVVEFSGRGAYDPGDAEGVAVKLGRVRRRTPLADWIAEQSAP